MQISRLAKKLNLTTRELVAKALEYGFRISPKTTKISDRKAKEIIRKAKRERRQAEKEEERKKLEAEEKKKTVTVRKILIPRTISVRDLAQRLGKPPADVIFLLMKNKIIATLNEEIDFETAALVVSEFGFEAEEEKTKIERLKEKGIKRILEEEQIKADESKLKTRPPVVCVMGHVDHGKSKLIEALREISIIAHEAGGITQHIGAYQVKEKGKLITFLDTPGHEAFRTMRERGARVTDIVVLVVAADDGVMPQTKEAIHHAQRANLPIIVAINKIDLPEADPEKVKKQLADLGLVPEEWGGETICVEISAKKKINLSTLLEMILLVAEMLNLKANPEAKALGTIIESRMDPEAGVVATVIVQNGTLRLGDPVICGDIFGVIKSMENFQGKKIDHAKPSTPVKILGLESVPQVGDILQVEESREKAKERVLKIRRISQLQKVKTLGKEEKSKKRLNLIIKADVFGSAEAIASEISKIKTEEVKPNIILQDVGRITESDILLASTSNALILGFNTEITPVAKRLAVERGIEYKIFNVIYELIDALKKKLSSMIEEKVIIHDLGRLKVLAIFRTEKGKMIIGGRITKGKLKKGAKVTVLREGKEIGQGTIENLQEAKIDVQEAGQGKEVGLMFRGQVKIKVDDILSAWEEERKKEMVI